MLKRVAARMCHLKHRRKFPDLPVPDGKIFYQFVTRLPAIGSVLDSRRTGTG
jgi:hypothetical protein